VILKLKLTASTISGCFLLGASTKILVPTPISDPHLAFGFRFLKAPPQQVAHPVKKHKETANKRILTPSLSEPIPFLGIGKTPNQTLKNF